MIFEYAIIAYGFRAKGEHRMAARLNGFPRDEAPAPAGAGMYGTEAAAFKKSNGKHED